MLKLMPKLTIPDGKLSVHIVFGFSNPNSDIDNCLKPFLDILQLAYKFNDNRIYHLSVEKIITPKQKEFINFTITN